MDLCKPGHFGLLDERVRRSILSAIRNQYFDGTDRNLTIYALENAGRAWDDSISSNSDFYGTWTVDIFDVAKWLAVKHQEAESREFKLRQDIYETEIRSEFKGWKEAAERNPLSMLFWRKLWRRLKAR